ncbi:unnamed protein product [Alopecurus aequalis]
MEAAVVAASSAAAAAKEAALAASAAAATAAKDAAAAAATANEATAAAKEAAAAASATALNAKEAAVAASATALHAKEAAATASAVALHAKEAADVAVSAGEAAASATLAMQASKKRKFHLIDKGLDPPGSANADDGESVDFISRLPDAVLGSIVSLLPTKEGARTQAISRRWRPLWRSAPLNLTAGHGFWSKGLGIAGMITKILSEHPGPARRFAYHRGYYKDCDDKIGGWLSSQTLDNLHELELTYYLGSLHMAIILNCTCFIFLQKMIAVGLTAKIHTMRVLVLDSDGLNLDKVVNFLKCFPCLEKLYFIFQSMDYVQKHDPLDRIECFELHLKEMVLKNYDGTIPACIDFTKFFVLNAKVLKEMKIKLVYHRQHKWFANQRRLLRIENRASRDARIELTCGSKDYFTHNSRTHDLSMTDPFDMPSSGCEDCRRRGLL